MRQRRVALGMAAVIVLALGGIAVLHGAATATLMRIVAVGGTPVSLVLDNRTERVFVAGAAGNGVAVLDAQTGHLMGMVAQNTFPGIGVVDTRHNRVFFLNLAGLNLTEINGTTGRLVRVMGLLATPHAVGGLVVVPRTGRVFVADRSAETVSVFDGASGAVVSVLPADLGVLATGGVGPDAVPLAADERTGRVFVLGPRPFTPAMTAHPLDYDILVLDADGRRVRRTIGGGHAPESVALDSARERAFVVERAGLTVLDTHSLSLLRTVPLRSTATSPLVSGAPIVDEGTGRVFIATTAGTVTVLDAASGRRLRVFQEPYPLVALLVDAPTGRVVAVGDNSIGILDGRSGALVRRIAEDWPLDPLEPSAAIDARNGQILVAVASRTNSPGVYAGAGSVSVLDGHSGTLIRRIPVGVAPVAIAVDDRTGRVFVLNQGGAVTVTDPWVWLPGWLRDRLPFVPRGASCPCTRIVPASVSMIDRSR